ncbi:DUF5329 domain-containing protein [Massilia sp. UYP11]|uniref:DUF5329 domain-containing protein n=1 Tax=Massilia sp. UYP11 TaxID=1756385 RepID=UPI003D20683C
MAAYWRSFISTFICTFLSIATPAHTMKRLTAILLIISPLFAHAEPPPAARQEIAHLIGYLTASGCSFQRNGSWHEAAKAASHLQRKYDYLLKRDLVASSEDFIARAASESSLSGKPYQVRCGGNAPVASAAWLRAELAKYRAARPSR